MMQSIGRRYVRYVNDAYRRTGTLWEGRYKAHPIDSEGDLLTCYRYIEMNPVRAAMVANPADYRWSSYRANAGGQVDGLVGNHPVYVALGASARERQEAYAALFVEPLHEPKVAELRQAPQSGRPLGARRFQEQIEQATGRRVRPGKPGRPRKEKQAHRRTAV